MPQQARMIAAVDAANSGAGVAPPVARVACPSADAGAPCPCGRWTIRCAAAPSRPIPASPSPAANAAAALRPRRSIDFTRRLDALSAGRPDRDAALALGMTPAALRRAGLPALPLLYPDGAARKTVLEKHAGTIDAETLRRLPEVIADPTLVVAQANGRFGVLIQDGRGQDVLVVIAPAVARDRRRVNLVVTVHARDRCEALLAGIAQGRLRYRHAERGRAWLAQAIRLHGIPPPSLPPSRPAPPATVLPSTCPIAASGRRFRFREPT
jgi:hypothetical protein